jgi:hypothetical protein
VRCFGRSLGARQEIEKAYRAKARDDLDRGFCWEVKTFCIFPALVKLMQADFVFRFAFPLAYLTYVLIALDEVNFGAPHMNLLRTSAPCYPGYAGEAS